jgi:hypothetical protein
LKTSVVLSIGKEKQAWFIIPGLIKLSGGGLVSDPCTLFVETLRLGPFFFRKETIFNHLYGRNNNTHFL